MNIIQTENIAEIKVQRSIFIAHISPVASAEAAKEYIKAIGKKHNKAHHNCWAYTLGEKGEVTHCSDNGEPSGSAGQPIQRSLQKHELTNIVAVVTRYYGGVKLGVRGLIDSYSGAVEDVIEESAVFPLIKTFLYKILFSYQHNDQILYTLDKLGVIVKDKNYLEKITLHLEVTEEVHDNFLQFLQQNKNFVESNLCSS